MGVEVTLSYDNWIAAQFEEQMLEGYFGWREPTHEELAQERLDRQDRLEDRGGGLMTPRREPARPRVSSQPAPVHHTPAACADSPVAHAAGVNFPTED